MGLFDFFKKKAKLESIIERVDEAKLTKNGFEFLITGDIELPAQGWEEILTPNSMEWVKTEKDEWTYFKVGEDDDSIPFDKAKKIADEVIENIRAIGQSAELVILNANTLYRF